MSAPGSSGIGTMDEPGKLFLQTSATALPVA